jgi:hypothetical protein
MVRSGSTLNVDLQADDDAAIVATLMTVRDGGDPREDRLRPEDFPLRLDVSPGTMLIVDVQVASVGRAANVTMRSEVSGADSRGPDVCRLEVDRNHPVAINSVSVVGS